MADWGGKVAAWFTGVAVASAALAALVAQMAKPLHGPMRDLFIVLVVITAVSFVALLLTGPRALWTVWRNRGRSESARAAGSAEADPDVLGDLDGATGSSPVTSARPGQRPLANGLPGGLRGDPQAGPGRGGLPASAMRVSAADPQLLGVHPAITVPGVADGVPPAYVERDVDAAEHGIRERLDTAAERGGFVLLVGGSSVGKTRSAYEAVRACMPEWWLVHPGGPGEIAALDPPSRLVLWLDEIERYFGGGQGLTGGVVRKLLTKPGPVVIVATIWPERFDAYTAVPTLDVGDRFWREREVLDLAQVVRISPDFSPAEQARAHTAAVRDRRLRAALAAAGSGLTQTLSAGPLLVARWEDAKTADPYAWAVLTAALDAARLGARAPLGADLLRSAAAGYCTSQQQAEAPPGWFEQALDYATRKLRGATAPLCPAGAGMGETAGYTAADYLSQHATRARRAERVRASTWDALLTYVQAPGDASRIAAAAASRLLYRYAIPLYQRAIDLGDKDASPELADLLTRSGDLDGLRARADAGDEHALHRLVSLLAERGELTELRTRADGGDTYVHGRLINLLAERGDLDELRTRADAGDERAADRLAGLLAQRGDLGELELRADTGDTHALHRLTPLLIERGERGKAIEILSRHETSDDGYAARRLSRLLAEQGNLDKLRARADAGDIVATRLLARKLTEHGELDEAIQILRVRVSAGDDLAANWMAQALAQRNDLGELRARAQAGDRHAARELARLLTQHGELDELQARADSGDPWADAGVADLLAQRGLVSKLRARADVGNERAADRLARLLAQQGNLRELQTRADTGDEIAGRQLATLLAERGAVAQLTARADDGDASAAHELVNILTERADLDGLRARVNAGDVPAAWRLAPLLIDRGDLDEAINILRNLTAHSDAAAMLARLLAQRGDLDELRTRTEADDPYAAHALADLLAQRGDLDELSARTNAGDRHAAELMAELIAQRGTSEQAARLRQFGLNADGSIAFAPGDTPP